VRNRERIQGNCLDTGMWGKREQSLVETNVSVGRAGMKRQESGAPSWGQQKGGSQKKLRWWGKGKGEKKRSAWGDTLSVFRKRKNVRQGAARGNLPRGVGRIKNLGNTSQRSSRGRGSDLGDVPRDIKRKT